jgi:hypothetical protein
VNLCVNLLFDLVNVDVGNSVGAVEDAGNLFQGRALGLDVDKVHEEELAKVPELRNDKLLATYSDNVSIDSIGR